MKLKRMKIVMLIAFLVLSAILFLPRASSSGGQEQAVVYVDPPEIKDLMPPANFTIKVKIANVTNLYGIDLQFTWNPTIIKYVSHQKHIPKGTSAGQWPDGVLNPPTIPVKDDVDESASMPGAEPGTRYWLAEASILPAKPFNGSGVIFEMKFTVVGLGKSPLHFTACTLADKNGDPIPVTLIDGLFINYVPPPPPPAYVSVDPRRIVDSTLNPCQYFTVSIKVEDVQDLHAFDFWLGYNGTLLEVSTVGVNPIFQPPIITKEEGQIEVSSSLSPPQISVSGDLYLANITFHILDKGETVLDLHDVTLLNSEGGKIEIYEPNDGYFNNMLITRMFVYPPELIDPTMKPGDTFSIDIMIENAIDMYDYEFKLAYDTNVLTCLGAIIVPPNNDTHFTVEMNINDIAGLIRVYVQYYQPAEPFSIYEAKTVTHIFFMVQDYGQTVLDLFDTRISDQTGNSMRHETEDGFFATLLRDVAIISVTVTSSNKVYPGRIVTIEVVAMNRGNMTTETFNVTLYAGTIKVGVQTVTLAPWTNTTLTFNWNTSGLTPCSNLTAWAEASPVPYEINLENNIYHDGWVKIKMIGDVNGDGVIDILDIVAITISYSTHEGDPNWNPDADIAPPWGFINILDLVTCSSKYGQRC
ncbi:MAG: CARDB domain-containing protein [Candidatus Bathyarchaeia archaeon]